MVISYKSWKHHKLSSGPKSHEMLLVIFWGRVEEDSVHIETDPYLFLKHALSSRRIMLPSQQIGIRKDDEKKKGCGSLLLVLKRKGVCIEIFLEYMGVGQ